MSETSAAVPPADVTPPSAVATTSTPAGLLITPAIVLILALLAGAGTWLALDRWYPVYGVPDELVGPPTANPVAPSEQVIAAILRATRQNTLYAYVWIGALGGLLLGAVEGYLQRRWIWAGVGLFVGAVIGTLGGASGACSAHEISEWMRSRETVDSMQLSIAVHGVGWGFLGGGLGLGMAMLGRRPRTLARATLGGAVGGGIVGALFPMIAAGVWPDANTEILVPSVNAVRVFWLLFGLGLTSLGAVLLGREVPR